MKSSTVPLYQAHGEYTDAGKAIDDEIGKRMGKWADELVMAGYDSHHLQLLLMQHVQMAVVIARLRNSIR